jgi:hypothetical protein
VLCVLVLPVINIPTPVYAIGGQQQVIIGGLSDPLSKTATEYNCLSGGENWETLLEDGQIFSAPGALSSFKVSLTQPAGTGAAYILTIVDSTQSTSLATTISGASDTTGVSTGSISIVAGDLVYLQSSYTGTPANTPGAEWSSIFTSTNNNESQILGQGATAVATRYLPVSASGWDTGITTEGDVAQVIPTSGTIKNFYVLIDNNPGGGSETYTFTINQNGSPTSLSVSIVGTSTSGFDTTAGHDISVVAGDTLSIKITASNTPSNTPLAHWGMTFTSTTANESIYLGGGNDYPTLSANRYTSLNTGKWTFGNIWNTSEGTLQDGSQAITGMTLKNLYVKLKATSGGDYVFTVRQNGGTPSPSITTTITAGGTTGSDTAHSITPTDYGQLGMMVYGLTTQVRSSWGIVCYIDTSTAPTVTTSTTIGLSSTIVTGGADVTSDGGQTVTERGVVVNTTGTPTTSDLKFSTSGTTGVFTVSITGLTASTVYHLRGYAINSKGTSYDVAGEITFTTLATASSITPVASSVLTNANTGDPTILSGGNIYSSSRFYVGGTNHTVKVATSDMSVAADYSSATFTSNLNAIAVSGSYVWIGEYNISEPDGNFYLYKLNQSDLSFIQKNSLYYQQPIEDACTDDTYIYWMGKTTSNSMPLGSLKISDNTIADNAISVTGSYYAHAIGVYGGSIYAALVPTGSSVYSKILKINPSTLAITQQITLPISGAFTDDWLTDGTYFYVFGEQGNIAGYLYRFLMSDISQYTSVMISSTEGIDGASFVTGTTKDGYGTGDIIVSDQTVASNGIYNIYRIKSDLSTITPFTINSGYSDSFFQINEVMSDGTYFYVMAMLFENQGQSRFIKSNIGDLNLPAPTGVTVSQGTSTSSVTISWNSVSGATSYHVFRGASDLGAQTSPYVDSGADAPTITDSIGGTPAAAATDGTSTSYSTLTNNAVFNNGVTDSYTVVAYNTNGAGAPSSPAAGYRGHGTPTYLWYRSSNGTDYTSLGGSANTSTYNDTTGTAGTVYYYRVVLSATGVSPDVTSSADTGYKATVDTTPAILTTTGVTGITTIGATSGGNITSTGSTSVDERGLCYGVGLNPDVSGSHIIETAGQPYGIGSFPETIASGLTSGTLYHVRAYAHNGAGYSYGGDVSFYTLLDTPTGLSASQNDSTQVVLGWKSTNNATGYNIYRNGSLLTSVGDVATYNDTTANAPTINASSTIATNSTTNIILSLSSITASNGPSYSYTVTATNAQGESAMPTIVNGLRPAAAVTYQWNKSSGDGDSGYSPVGGQTLTSYTDSTTGAPTITAGSTVTTQGTFNVIQLSLSGTAFNSGTGFYYTCTLTSTGASNTPLTATAARGARISGTSSYQWQQSAADSDASYSNISGATGATYSGTAGVSSLTKRYYKCVISASPATQQTSSASEGWWDVNAKTPDAGTNLLLILLPIELAGVILIILALRFKAQSISIKALVLTLSISIFLIVTFLIVNNILNALR